jgi:hypothetical protein
VVVLGNLHIGLQPLRAYVPLLEQETEAVPVYPVAHCALHKPLLGVVMYPVVELGIKHVEAAVQPESAKVPPLVLHVTTAVPV